MSEEQKPPAPAEAQVNTGAIAQATADAEKAAAEAQAAAESVAVAEYQRDLQTKLFEIESRFDNATLLVAGGAFTVSAAFCAAPQREWGRDMGSSSRVASVGILPLPELGRSPAQRQVLQAAH